MGAKQKKAMKKQLSKAASAQISASATKAAVAPAPASTAPDFLPLEGGPARKIPQQKPKEEVAKVVYIGRIPHGFYENEMLAFFGQFGVINKLRIARSKKTGKSKHFGFIEFEDPGVAKIVAETMHNYLLFEHLLQVHLIPPERVHPKLWKGYNIKKRPLNWVKIERKRHDKERTLEEHKKLVEKIKKRDLKRQKRIEAAGIDYECPAIVTHDQPAPKKKKRDLKRQKRIEAAGIDYECPAIVTHDQPAPKKKKRDLKPQKRIEAAGIDYECPAIVTHDQPAPKKKKLRLK